MKDMVRLSKSGGTLGFTIQPSILIELGLTLKDPVTIRIFDDKGEISAEFSRPIKKMGKGSLGVTIRYFIVDKLKLNYKDVIRIDISKPT